MGLQYEQLSHFNENAIDSIDLEVAEWMNERSVDLRSSKQSKPGRFADMHDILTALRSCLSCSCRQ